LKKNGVTERLVRKHGALTIADVEYRVVRDERTGGWDVLRNGTPTDISARRKLKSAIDCAIRDAKAELDRSKAKIVVTCLQGRKLESMWRGA
jgi:hypothetical protein